MANSVMAQTYFPLTEGQDKSFRQLFAEIKKKQEENRVELLTALDLLFRSDGKETV